jgi:hypothetical protein
MMDESDATARSARGWKLLSLIANASLIIKKEHQVPVDVSSFTSASEIADSHLVASPKRKNRLTPPIVLEFAVVDTGILRTPHPSANRYALVPITSARIYAKKEKSVFDRKRSDVFFEQLLIHFAGWKFYEAWGDIKQNYGADRTIVTFDPKFSLRP